jgi:Endosomal/lysosomal potassium channel TMEM175
MEPPTCRPYSRNQCKNDDSINPCFLCVDYGETLRLLSSSTILDASSDLVYSIPPASAKLALKVRAIRIEMAPLPDSAFMRFKVDQRLGHSKERAVSEEKETAHRLAACSDAVFAVIVTVMVLELRAPDQPAFSALWPLWPAAITYAVSYLFIAIIWINHHYLMRFIGRPTLD